MHVMLCYVYVNYFTFVLSKFPQAIRQRGRRNEDIEDFNYDIQ